MSFVGAVREKGYSSKRTAEDVGPYRVDGSDVGATRGRPQIRNVHKTGERGSPLRKIGRKTYMKNDQNRSKEREAELLWNPPAPAGHPPLGKGGLKESVFLFLLPCFDSICKESVVS